MASGPWFVSATSADVDWRVAVAALIAAARVRVAVIALDPAGLSAPTAPDEPEPAQPESAGPPLPSTTLEVRDPAELTLADAVTLVRAVAATHGLTLVAATPGFLVPVGRDGWTPADLAAETRGSALVVTGPGPDPVNHTTLALGALAGHGIAASVVVVGDLEDEAALPVTPAGRVPVTLPDDLAAVAPEWFDPVLLATPPVAAAVPAASAGRKPLTSGRKVVLGLLGVFVLMIVLACALGWVQRAEVRTEATITSAPNRSGVTVPETRLVPTVAVPRPDACPPYRGGVTPARPDAATTARVNAAWQRIETWLKKNAPASHRSLRPPAEAADIDALQRRMSVAFPPDLVASLRRHDGASSMAFDLPPFFTPSTLSGIVGDWQVKCGILTADDTSWGAEPWWDRRFVPFAMAGDGGSLLVDQRPGGHGRVGEFYPEDGTSFERWPASVTELLEGTARALETGRAYAGRYTPKVDADGRLDWAIN